MENISDEELNSIMIINLLIGKNLDYMLKTIYEFETENGVSQIIYCENLFEDVSPQQICLKIVHDMSMMGSYLKNYVAQTGAKCDTYSSKEKNLYVKFLIGTENIDILKKKGFGFLAYNINDFAYCLFKFNEALKLYLEEKSKEKEFKFLNIILDNWFDYFFKDPNTAMFSFISKNNTFLQNEIKEVENLMNNKN